MYNVENSIEMCYSFTKNTVHHMSDVWHENSFVARQNEWIFYVIDFQVISQVFKKDKTCTNSGWIGFS